METRLVRYQQAFLLVSIWHHFFIFTSGGQGFRTDPDHADVKRPPNIILFVADDMGYGDLSVYGHPTQEWGPVDDMARDGMRFTQFYSVANYCTPSRTAMLTGRFPMRSGMDGDDFVHLQCHNQGLPHSEITVAESLQKAGYRTGIVGKWHLGTNAHSHNDGMYLPHTHGFDYVGHIIPHTLVWDCDSYKRHRKQPKCSKCYLFRNTTIVQQPTRLENLTATFLDDAKAFIYENQHQPFFLYYSFPQTHTPMFHMDGFKGSSKRGIFGDQVNEMAWSLSEVMKLVKELGLERDTLSVFVSDHGPHLEMCEESGSPSPFYGGKANFFEGGVRVPAIAHWPGTVPAGVTSTMVLTLMDLFSTFIDLAGAEYPRDRHIDGQSFAHIIQPGEISQTDNKPDMLGQTLAHSSERRINTKLYFNEEIHDILYFFCMDRTLTAVRYKQFKIYLRQSPRDVHEGLRRNCDGSFPRKDYYHNLCVDAVPADPPIIYNVEEDPNENYPLHSDKHLDILSEVKTLVELKMKTLVDLPLPRLTSQSCSKRFIPCCNPPYCVC